MTEEDRQVQKAVADLMAVCTSYPVEVALSALPEVLGQIIAMSANDRATAKQIGVMMKKRLDVVIFERAR